MSNNAIVWSQPNCQYCDMAKLLLKSKGYTVEERVVSVTHTKEQLLQAVPGARSVPQIFVNGKLVTNGYNGLKEMLGA